MFETICDYVAVTLHIVWHMYQMQFNTLTHRMKDILHNNYIYIYIYIISVTQKGKLMSDRNQEKFWYPVHKYNYNWKITKNMELIFCNLNFVFWYFIYY